MLNFFRQYNKDKILDDIIFSNENFILDSLKGQRFASDLMVSFGTDGSRRLLQELQKKLNQYETLTDQHQVEKKYYLIYDL